MALTTATYARTSPSSTVTVTSSGHTLVVGDVIYADFTSGTATDGTFTVTAVTAGVSFQFTGGATTTTSGNINYLKTKGDTWSQTGTLVTITRTNHEFVAGAYVGLAFVGPSLPADGGYTIESVLDANTFTVRSLVSSSSSGGVRVYAKVVLGAFAFTTDGRCAANVSVWGQRSAYSFTTDGRCDAVDANVSQFAAYSFRISTARCDALSVSQTQACAYQFTTKGDVRAGREVDHATAYSFTTDGRCDPSSFPEDQDAFFEPATINFILTAAYIIVPGRETVTNIIDDAAKMLGRAAGGMSLNTALRQSVLDYLNAVMQLLFSRAEMLDYFNQEVRTYTLPATETDVSLPADVQTVDGKVCRASDKKRLSTISQLSEFERFTDLYPGVSASTVPLAVYVNRSTAPNSPDGFTHKLQFVPAPVADFEFEALISIKAPKYSWADYLDHTPLSIAHRYAQSLLYPLMREQLLSNPEFAANSKRDAVVQQAAIARQQLGLVDTAPAPTKKPKDPQLADAR